MPSQTSLRELLAKAVPTTKVEIVAGVVQSADPIEIYLSNGSDLVVTESNVFIPKRLTDMRVSISLSGFSMDDDSIGPITGWIHNALQKGDEVYLLSYDNGALYYVLDRV